MKCPNDNSSLILKAQENALAHCCMQCNGVFFKRTEVEAFKYNFETDFLERAFANKKTNEINRECANCNEKMHNVIIDSIAIDLCNNCKSVFFQKGQLTKIKEKHLGITHQESFFHNLLPWPLLAIHSVYKLFTVDSNSKSKCHYKWSLIATVIFFVLWLALN